MKAANDIQMKVSKAKFLGQKHKVLVSVMFRGRLTGVDESAAALKCSYAGGRQPP